MSVDLEDEFHKKTDKIMKREAMSNLGLRVTNIVRMTLVDRAINLIATTQGQMVWFRRRVGPAIKEASKSCFETQRPYDAPASPGFEYGKSSSNDDCRHTKLPKRFWYGQVLSIQNVVRNNTSQQGENTPYEPEYSPPSIYITFQSHRFLYDESRY